MYRKIIRARNFKQEVLQISIYPIATKFIFLITSTHHPEKYFLLAVRDAGEGPLNLSVQHCRDVRWVSERGRPPLVTRMTRNSNMS